MISLSDFKPEPESITVKLRGKEVVLTELTAIQTTLVRKAFKRPVPPLAQDPNRKASEAHLLLPNEQDPKFQTEVSDWLAKVVMADIAIAMGYQTKDGSSAPRDESGIATWAEKSVGELQVFLSDREVDKLAKALYSIGADKDERGNSSVPPKMEQPAGQ